MKHVKLTFLIGAVLLAQQPDARKPDRTVSILAERFTYNPSRINVKQGQLVEFVLEVRVRFLARDKGTFEFECSRACGAGHHVMRGAIIVK